MARIRTIKPEFFKSETLELCEDFTKLLFIGLWTYVDDDGRGVYNARLIRGELFPLRDSLSLDELELHMQALVDAGLVAIYEVDGRRYLWVRAWREHQKVNRPTASKLPAPSEENLLPGQGLLVKSSVKDHGGLTEDSRQERKGTGKGKEQGTGIASVGKFSEDSRKQDLLWEAVMWVCRIDTAKITPSARGGYNKALKELRQVGAQPEQVPHVAMAYRMAMPNAPLTPTALAKWWASAEGVATQPKVDKHAAEVNEWVNAG